MNQLEYIKSKFFEKSTLIEFIPVNDELDERYIDFQKTLKTINESIKKSEDVESVLSHIKEAQRSFLVHWQFFNVHTEHVSFEKMRSLYFTANLSQPEEWLKNTITAFEEKKSNKFFELTTKGMKFIGETLDKFNSLADNVEIEKVANEIIKKYNLNHINLSNIKESKHLKYLKDLDSGLEKVCTSMGVTTDVIGINGTVGFSSSPHSEAFFLSEKNSITTGGLMHTSSTLLHEWVHSLDYYVGNSISPGKFASNIEEAVHIEDSNMYKSFMSIKLLTQEIFNSSNSLDYIEPIKKGLITEGTSKFFSELLGYDFYALPEKIKNSLHSQHSFDLVNNYLVNPSLESNQTKLLEFITAQNIQSAVITDKIQNPSPEITSLKAYFDGVNQNLFNNPSLYHISSKLSRFGLKLDNFITGVFQKGIDLFKKDVVAKTQGNSHDNDYFIQPIEMVARYFESQVFPNNSKLNNIIGIIGGVCAYKLTKDSSFERNKDQIIEHVFGKDKILKNISGIRTNINDNELKTQNPKLNF